MNRIDDLIDNSLHALREARPSTNLQQRILQTLHQRAAQPQPRFHPSMWLLATATGCLTAALLLSWLHNPLLHPNSSTETHVATSTQGLETRNFPTRNSKLNSTSLVNLKSQTTMANLISPATDQVPRSFSFGSHRLSLSGALAPEFAIHDDPDTVALAETLAPSHPAPVMPLTRQERLLASATRQGQPIEVAELELARQPFLKAAAEARERAGMEHFIHAILSPLLLSESFNSAPGAQPADSAETGPAKPSTISEENLNQ